MWQDELDRAIDERFDAMVAVRRRLHMRPELSGQETDTSLYLYQLLGDEGFDVRLGAEGRGLIADSISQPPAANGMIALRADIDALHIHDAKNTPYRSQNDGIMHACGHDAHTAVVYGALGAIRQLNKAGALPVDVAVRGVFQPAEETSEGARQMISVGALDGVGAIFGLHVDPSRDVGRVGLREGVLMRLMAQHGAR